VRKVKYAVPWRKAMMMYCIPGFFTPRNLERWNGAATEEKRSISLSESPLATSYN